jgi:uncharacterized protein (TIGR00255 family)
MKSMTGYGKAVASSGNFEITVELKSVNHRFLDISTKIPRMFLAHEDIVRSVLSDKFSRGHIDVFLNYNQNSSELRAVKPDLALAESYLRAATQLSDAFHLDNDYSLTALLKTPDIFTIEQTEVDTDRLRELLTEAVSAAADNLNNMRAAEGDKLAADIAARLYNIEQLLSRVKTFAPEVADDYAAKLSARIAEVLKNIEIDQSKLANEVAFFVDKSNIDEEIARLDSHIYNARDILKLAEPIGRKMDFLVQEFNREANTICSKSNNVTLTNIALELKNEIEKVREQVQNLE